MKILHITTTRELGSGQRTQLTYEYQAAKRLSSVEWSVTSLHCDMPKKGFEKRIPAFFRSVQLLRLYGWIYAIKNQRHYDLILFRDLQLDPFGPLLGWLVRNRVTVHHSLEIEEMKILDRPRIFRNIAVAFEKYIKPITQRSALGLIGISNQVVEYELKRFPWLRNRATTYPNGAEVSSGPLAEIRHAQDKIAVVFAASKFTAWHGLDRLLDEIRSDEKHAQKFEFHLVGSMSQEQLTEVGSLQANFVLHGALDPQQFREVLLEADVGLDSLALDRQGLEEASTLKAREYLRAGVPVYSNHPDTAFSENFVFYRNDGANFSLKGLHEFSMECSSVAPTEIYLSARPHIEEEAIMRDLAHILEEWCTS